MVDTELFTTACLCPMVCFDRWYYAIESKGRTRMMCIEDDDSELRLDATSIREEPHIFLEGVTIDADPNNDFTSVRPQVMAALALQATKHSRQVGGLIDMLKSLETKLDTMDGNQSCDSYKLKQNFDDLNIKLNNMETDIIAQSQSVSRLETWTENQTLLQSAEKKEEYRPFKRLWEKLNDWSYVAIKDIMEVITDCGVENRAVVEDGAMKSKNGFVINVLDYEGPTPLILAIHAGRNDVVKALLDLGANHDIIFGRTTGNTPLIVAAVDSNLDAIELLLGCGADLLKPNMSFFTALHQGAYNGHTKIIEALVREGASLTAKNYFGHTAQQTFADKPIRPHSHLTQSEQDRLNVLLTSKATDDPIENE
eukprot:GILI01013360.1.p1 GENE.GILI01013360.1~~GILI01013360.1.p1  ORF type:complete len:411 (-),score=41.46 GILI01013360.1:118-1221(-)